MTTRVSTSTSMPGSTTGISLTLAPSQPSTQPPPAKEESTPAPISAVPNSKTSPKVVHICPSKCLNGGTCQLDNLGELECVCSKGFWGPYCENAEGTPEAISTATIEMESAINARQVTSTSIAVDLHRYIQARRHLKGIRLTYRNLSGPDKRPMHLNLPPSYPEYTVRGLRPNSTYYICASPMGEPEQQDSCCVEAQISSQEHHSPGGRPPPLHPSQTAPERDSPHLQEPLGSRQAANAPEPATILPRVHSARAPAQLHLLHLCQPYGGARATGQLLRRSPDLQPGTPFPHHPVL
ncbi:UNVERIFIED_CONTAM: hypothetical protein FKN15_000814 [Acipenser sinensis]